HDARDARTRRRVCDRCSAEFEYRAIPQGVDLKQAVCAHPTPRCACASGFQLLEASRTVRLRSRERHPLSTCQEFLTAAGAEARSCGTQVHVVRAQAQAKACGVPARCQASSLVRARSSRSTSLSVAPISTGGLAPGGRGSAAWW